MLLLSTKNSFKADASESKIYIHHNSDIKEFIPLFNISSTLLSHLPMSTAKFFIALMKITQHSHFPKAMFLEETYERCI
jgi:hypothetical protein